MLGRRLLLLSPSDRGRLGTQPINVPAPLYWEKPLLSRYIQSNHINLNVTHEEGTRSVQRRRGRETVRIGLGDEVLQEFRQVREGRVHRHLPNERTCDLVKKETGSVSPLSRLNQKVSWWQKKTLIPHLENTEEGDRTGLRG